MILFLCVRVTKSYSAIMKYIYQDLCYIYFIFSAGNCSQPSPATYSFTCATGISGYHCEQVDSVYLNAGGHITVPIPRSGPEAAQDVMSLSFTYRTFKHTGVLLSITAGVSLLLAFTVRDVGGPWRTSGEKE